MILNHIFHYQQNTTIIVAVLHIVTTINPSSLLLVRYIFLLCFALVNHQKTTEKKKNKQKNTPHETRTTKKAGLHPGTPLKTVVFLLMAQKSGEKTSWETGSWNPIIFSTIFLHHARCLHSRISEASNSRTFFLLGGDTQQSNDQRHRIVHRLGGEQQRLWPTRWSCPKAAVSSQGVVAYLKATLQAARVRCLSLNVKLTGVFRFTVNLGERKTRSTTGWKIFFCGKEWKVTTTFFFKEMLGEAVEGKCHESWQFPMEFSSQLSWNLMVLWRSVSLVFEWFWWLCAQITTPTWCHFIGALPTWTSLAIFVL